MSSSFIFLVVVVCVMGVPCALGKSLTKTLVTDNMEQTVKIAQPSFLNVVVGSVCFGI